MAEERARAKLKIQMFYSNYCRGESYNVKMKSQILYDERRKRAFKSL
jgi:hypothetical protein